jgi:pimeloyl-ACP methyl ester carboxylesterase
MPISACKTRHRMVSAGGLNLFVREAGERTQPAVLLIHGQPTSSHTFRNLMPLLADTAYLVAPDMPGFGFSDAPPLDRYEYSFANIADTIDALIDVLGLERMVLYVHDYGAAVAYHLAMRRPIKTTLPAPSNCALSPGASAAVPDPVGSQRPVLPAGRDHGVRPRARAAGGVRSWPRVTTNFASSPCVAQGGWMLGTFRVATQLFVQVAPAATGP